MTMAAVTSEVVVTIWRAGVVKKAIPAQVAEWVRRYNMASTSAETVQVRHGIVSSGPDKKHSHIQDVQLKNPMAVACMGITSLKAKYKIEFVV